MSRVHIPGGRLPVWSGTSYQVVGIDPAIKRNLGLWVERRDVTNLKITNILAELINFEHIIDAGGSFVTYLTEYLDRYLDVFMACHLILIELQEVSLNTRVMLVAQHLVSYFCLRLARSPCQPMIIEVDSHLKSHLLNSPNVQQFVLAWSSALKVAPPPLITATPEALAQIVASTKRKKGEKR